MYARAGFVLQLESCLKFLFLLPSVLTGRHEVTKTVHFRALRCPLIVYKLHLPMCKILTTLPLSCECTLSGYYPMIKVSVLIVLAKTHEFLLCA